MRFTKPTKVVGLDIGSHSVKAVQMAKTGGKLRIEDVGYALVDREQVNVDPVAAHADALREALRRMPTHQCEIVGALPGQTVVIRYPRLRNVKLEDIDRAIEKEAGQNIPYDLSEVFLDWSLLEEEGDDEEAQLKVLLVAAKHEIIDSRVQVADAADMQFGVLSVDSLALADAAEGCDFLRVGETVALINIGASSVSIHFTRDGVSNFIRDVSWGAKEMIQAIAKSRHIEYEEAEELLYDIEHLLSEEHGKREAASVAAEGHAEEPHQMPSAEIDLDNAGLLDPLDGELGSLGEPEPEPVGLAAEDDFGDEPHINVQVDADLSEVLAPPISRLVSEIRRSFDYYEHQLYERPVDRIILSGGIANLSLIRHALKEDLGVEDVLVADPLDGAIMSSRKVKKEMQRHPSQFMVAVGLAARGAAEL